MAFEIISITDHANGTATVSYAGGLNDGSSYICQVSPVSSDSPTWTTVGATLATTAGTFGPFALTPGDYFFAVRETNLVLTAYTPPERKRITDASASTGLLEENLVAYLLDSDGVTDLVADRINPQGAPEGGLCPYLAFEVVDEQPANSMDGYTGPTATLVQITCWGETYLQAKQLREAVRMALSGYSGPMGAGSVQAVLHDGGSDEIFPAPGQQQQRRRGVRIDFRVWRSEEKPVFV